MRFEFATATRVIFGSGTVQELASLAAGMGSRPFVVTDNQIERGHNVVALLNKQGLQSAHLEVTREPTTDIINDAVRKARKVSSDLVIGIGGGSVIDTAKAVAAMLTNKGQLEDYLEVVGRGNPLTERPVPCIAIPTTAGTGAEVTRNAVIAVPDHAVKVSMRSPFMLPRLALVDPVLTHSMPPAITASTGLDALTQVMEPYVSTKANPLTDAVCLQGMKRAARSLQKACENGSDAAAREDMSLASLLGGLALANSGLGAVHGFAGPLGGMIHAPHGVICARLLPHVMETNVRALQARASDSPALTRYDEIAQILTGDPAAKASDGVQWIQQLCAGLEVPPLTTFGLTEKDYPTAVEKAQKASSMKGNPITLTTEELTEILKNAA